MREITVRILSLLGIRDAALAILRRLGYLLVRVESPAPPPGVAEIPDAECYQPFFTPWLRDVEFNKVFSLIAPSTIVSIDRCYTLWTLAAQALRGEGEFLECGVYKGGTARLLAEVVQRFGAQKRIHLFDTFQGMPATTEVDLHQEGDFVDTSIREVETLIGRFKNVVLHPGRIPETFRGIESVSVAFAHVDVDIFQSDLDCCEFIYPRLVPGGVMIFDDYGFATCPGARMAVDSFFADKPERPLILPNAQAVVIRCQ
jgi:O-methyltransferase